MTIGIAFETAPVREIYLSNWSDIFCLLEKKLVAMKRKVYLSHLKTACFEDEE